MASCLAAAVAAALAAEVCRAAYQSRPRVAPRATEATRARATTTHTRRGVMRATPAVGVARPAGSVVDPLAGSASVMPAIVVGVVTGAVVVVLIERPPS